MKRLLTSAVVLAIAASAGAASAQPGPHRDDDRYEQRHDRQADRRDDRRDDRRAERRDDRREDRYERRAERRYRAAPYRSPYGYQVRQWRHGDRLPVAYRSRAYVIDYRPYRLAPPPPGYQYVRVGNDVVLTATNTGLIASVILQLFQ